MAGIDAVVFPGPRPPPSRPRGSPPVDHRPGPPCLPHRAGLGIPPAWFHPLPNARRRPTGGGHADRGGGGGCSGALAALVSPSAVTVGFFRAQRTTSGKHHALPDLKYHRAVPLPSQIVTHQRSHWRTHPASMTRFRDRRCGRQSSKAYLPTKSRLLTKGPPAGVRPGRSSRLPHPSPPGIPQQSSGPANNIALPLRGGLAALVQAFMCVPLALRSRHGGAS